MSDQKENKPLSIQAQLDQIQIQLAYQEQALAIILEVIGSQPDLAGTYERACFHRLDAIGKKSPEVARELEQYLGRVLRHIVE
ncbi:hypothetical protein [Rodentibacter haemolyticus]|uniref:Uncharacterized protein n=1 Tax=Rodentibacter haemolyticus TaxID=2778911 RepID=A0ABX6V0L9_9PAST|nr:hypothetical protein [Rodentibacter haemolyticus]QPB43046.1 hypothetical protein IHV77_02710 [Rodentibacter haemolyticus]